MNYMRVTILNLMPQDLKKMNTNPQKMKILKKGFNNKQMLVKKKIEMHKMRQTQ